MAIDIQELMRHVARLRIITHRLVDEHLTGAYHSAFKGQGIEFAETRDYHYGDDVRSIDWNVTARMGHPFIKRFAEERELTILFAVDISGSQNFGSHHRTKAELAAELTCLLALSALKNQDNVGLILFSDKIEKMIAPRKGRTAALRLVREILATETTRNGTDIRSALAFLNIVQKRRAVVFLISDFQDEGYERELQMTARRHDLVCCHLSDPRERQLTNAGLVLLEDAETGQLQWVDTGSHHVRKAFTTDVTQKEEQQLAFFAKHGIDVMRLSTDAPVFEEVRRLLLRRRRRSRRHTSASVATKA